MRITHMIFSLKVGGAENIMIDIMNLQVELGHDLTLIIINDEINNILLNSIDTRINIIKLQRPEGSRNLYYFFKLYKILLLCKIDIIHAHSTGVGKILQFSKIKKIITVHGFESITQGLKYFDQIISISNTIKTAIIKKMNSESILIYNGINTNLLKISALENKNDKILLQVSRLVHKTKGQDILIKAMNLIVNEKKISHIKCHLIGEGDSIGYLKENVKKYGLENYVLFLGVQERSYVYENLSKYDLLVQPSRYEGFGLTIVEAMAAKVPVIVSNIEGPIEVIQNGDIGTYFESENSKDLANKILNILDNKENNIKVEAAYKFTKENYDIKQTVNKYLEEYINVINKGIKI